VLTDHKYGKVMKGNPSPKTITTKNSICNERGILSEEFCPEVQYKYKI